MHIQVKTNHPSNNYFTQDKVYEAEIAVTYPGGEARLATTLTDDPETKEPVFIWLVGPCAFLDSKGKWEVLKCDG